jgi:NIMA (never in mitosis gene a)-related kinase 1/4/5
VHRDIKTANIFFVNGIAKLGDLNISKVTENGFCSTQTGTPYYTSPEIWRGETYNSKCDIWALGCIIYEMATLSPPFKANDFPSLFKIILEGSYREIDKSYS